MYEDHRHKIQNNNPVQRIFVAITPKYQIQVSHMKTIVYIGPACCTSADIYWVSGGKETTLTDIICACRAHPWSLGSTGCHQAPQSLPCSLSCIGIETVADQKH